MWWGLCRWCGELCRGSVCSVRKLEFLTIHSDYNEFVVGGDLGVLTLAAVRLSGPVQRTTGISST